MRIKRVCFCSIVMLIVALLQVSGCSKNRQSAKQQRSLDLIFEEIYPENQGRMAPQFIQLDRWSWNLDLNVGDSLVSGLHYAFAATLDITLADRQTLELSLLGNAEEHHVSQSVRNLPLQFLKEAFLATSAKALDEEVSLYNLGIQYGKGYYVSGVSSGHAEDVRLKLAGTEEEIVLTKEVSHFAFEHPYEPGDVFEVQALNDPEGTCCKFTNGMGKIGESDVDNVILSCTPPQWTDPTGHGDHFLYDQYDEFFHMHTGYWRYDDEAKSIEMNWFADKGKKAGISVYKPQHDIFVHPDTNPFDSFHALLEPGEDFSGVPTYLHSSGFTMA